MRWIAVLSLALPAQAVWQTSEVFDPTQTHQLMRNMAVAIDGSTSPPQKLHVREGWDQRLTEENLFYKSHASGLSSRYTISDAPNAGGTAEAYLPS